MVDPRAGEGRRPYSVQSWSVCMPAALLSAQRSMHWNPTRRLWPPRTSPFRTMVWKSPQSLVT